MASRSSAKVQRTRAGTPGSPAKGCTLVPANVAGSPRSVRAHTPTGTMPRTLVWNQCWCIAT